MRARGSCSIHFLRESADCKKIFFNKGATKAIVYRSPPVQTGRKLETRGDVLDEIVILPFELARSDEGNFGQTESLF